MASFASLPNTVVPPATKKPEKCWNGEIVATASTHGFWEPDREFEIKVKVSDLKRRFHHNRYLRVKYLPTDVSQAEVRQMLSDFPVSHIKLTTGNGAAGSAKVYLEDPEMLEEWDKNRSFMLRGHRIPVIPSPTANLLCVARLPLSYTEAQFTGLVKSFGDVNDSFLMVSEKSGESKGYGFVEYKGLGNAEAAKMSISGLVLEGSNLWAEFVNPNQTTLDSLHSKCIYVYNLPPNYCDMADFRKRFSVIVNPPYCQIAFKKGCPLTWGLVEYNTAEDAEATFNKLQGQNIKGRLMKMSYYVPGVRAMNLYTGLLNLGEATNLRTNGVGLLPQPTMPSVYETFQNLRKQNPLFAQDLHDIMLFEINGGETPQADQASGPSERDQGGRHAGMKRIPSPSLDLCPVPAKRSGQQLVMYRPAQKSNGKEANMASHQLPGDQENIRDSCANSDVGADWPCLIQFPINTPPPPIQYDPTANPAMMYQYMPPSCPGGIHGVSPYPVMLPGDQTYSPYPVPYWMQMNMGMNGSASPDLQPVDSSDALTSHGAVEAWLNSGREMYPGARPIHVTNVNAPSNITTNDTNPTHQSFNGHIINPTYNIHNPTYNDNSVEPTYNNDNRVIHNNKIEKTLILSNTIKQNGHSEIVGRPKLKELSSRAPVDQDGSVADLYNLFSERQAAIESQNSPDLSPSIPEGSPPGHIYSGPLPKPIGYEWKMKNIRMGREQETAYDPQTAWPVESQSKYTESYYKGDEAKNGKGS